MSGFLEGINLRIMLGLEIDGCYDIQQDVSLYRIPRTLAVLYIVLYIWTFISSSMYSTAIRLS